MMRAAIFVLLVNVVTSGVIFIFGDGCVIMGDVLFRNGVNKGTLTSEQQQQLKEYQQKVGEWNTALQKSIQSNFPWHPSNPESKNFPWNPNGPGAPRAPNFGNSWPSGPENNPFGRGIPSNNAFVGTRRNFPPNWNGHSAPRAPNFGNSWPFGPENNPFGSGFPFNNAHVRARRSAVPPFPSPPPFCKQ